MTDYFGPMPQSSLNVGKVIKWVQEQTNTFYRSLSLRGTLQSSDFVSGTSGWRISTDGTAEFNEDVDIGGANTTNAQLFIHNTLQHINLLENDGTGYPDHQFIIDVNADLGRLFWRDSSGAPVSTEAIRIAQDGEVDFVTGPVLYPDGAAATPAITFRATGQQDVGIFRQGTDAMGHTVGGTEVARVTGAGLRGIANGAASRNEDVNGATNTSFADLDALTGAAFTGAVSVTVDTGTAALVIVSASILENSSASFSTILGYRVSGATTQAATDNFGARAAGTQLRSSTFVHPNVALNAGSNTFELQARVSGADGRIIHPSITVIPLNV
jgi:hypothetical protein